jgi:membrane-associated phospholipid phosphatase
MSEHPGRWSFLTLTVVLIFLLLVEWLGLFNGLNLLVDSALPRGGSLVVLLTDTASFAAAVLYLLAFVVWDILKRGKFSRFSLELAAGFLVSMVLVVVLKVLFAQPRPGEAQVHWSLLGSLKNIDYFAFPSGHTARAAVFAYFLSRRWKKLWPLWWGWALGIALSRLLLHVHWLGDVVFSLLLGPWVGMAVELTESRWLPYYRWAIRKLKLGVFDVE